VRGHIDGEGRYDQIERLIQKLLSQGPSPGPPEALSAVTGAGPQAAPDWSDLGSGETYVGYAQAAASSIPAACDATSSRCTTRRATCH
jgi:hypothetical protein